MRKRFCSIGVILLIGGTCVAVQGDEDRPDSANSPAKEEHPAPQSNPIVPQWAINAVRDGRFEEALPAYRRNVELNPNNADAHVNLAFILMRAKQLDESFIEARNATRLDPKSARAHSALGLMRFKTGKHEEGLDELRTSVRLEPNNPKYICDLACCLGMAGYSEECIEEFKHAIRVDPNYCAAHTNMGLALAQWGEYEEAIQCFTDSLEIKETQEARIGRARAYSHHGQFIAAVSDCDRVLLDDPKNHPAYACRAYSNMRRNELDAATRDTKQVLATGDELAIVAYVVLGGVNLAQHDTDAAIANLTKAIELNPDGPLAYVLRATTHLATLEFDKCNPDLDAAIRVAGDTDELNLALDGFGWQVYKFRGLINLFHRPSPDDAIADFTQAIKLNHQDPDCYALRGWAFFDSGDWQQALENCETALAIEPDHRIATHLLLQVLTQCPDDDLRDGGRALELAKKMCELTEWKSPIYIQSLAAAYAETGDFAYAAATQSKVVEMSRDQNRAEACPLEICWLTEYIVHLSVPDTGAVENLELLQKRKPLRLAERKSVASLEKDEPSRDSAHPAARARKE